MSLGSFLFLKEQIKGNIINIITIAKACTRSSGGVQHRSLHDVDMAQAIGWLMLNFVSVRTIKGVSSWLSRGC
jgi:hypothetical protein